MTQPKSNNRYAHRYFADGRYEKIPVDKCPSFEKLQEWVGGYVTQAKVRFGESNKICTMVMDEDGLPKRKPLNASATEFYRRMYPGVSSVIVGDVVIFEGFGLR